MSEPQPQLEIPTRAPAATSADDTILPFQVEALDLRGRVVRFGPAIDTILSRHNYPVPVAKLLGEAIVLTVLLGSTLKFEGRFILQTQSDGPVRMLVIDYTTPGKVRACARFDAARVAAAIASGAADPGALLGHGHLAMTIDQGPDTARYQGIVALEGKDLEHAAHEYFLRSEQIPTRVRLAVAEELRAETDGARHRWRAGGLLLQFLPQSPERARQPDLDPGDVPEGMEFQPQPEDDAWVRRPLAGGDGGGPGTARSRRVGRAAALPAVPRAAACACSAAGTCTRSARARARASSACCAAFRRTTATTWWRTGRSPSPASSATRLTCSRPWTC